MKRLVKENEMFVVKSKKFMTMEKLRGLCVEKNWCTNCTIKDYDALLNFVKDIENLTDNDLLQIAIHIEKNSIIEEIADYNEKIQHILYNLNKNTYTVYESMLEY